MEIKKAKVQGFCFGVAITLKKAEEAIDAREQVTTLGHVVHNPQILILDEATSALDSQSERLVQDAINQVVERTTAIVARFLTADRKPS